MRKFLSVVSLIVLLFFCGCSEEDNAVLHSMPLISGDSVKVLKIWDNDKYCSFTSLVKYKDYYYCAFREGTAHMGDCGSIRILVSPDAKKWTSRFYLSMVGYDLRDPNLSVTPDGRLMLICGRQILNHNTETLVSFLKDENSEFSEFELAKFSGLTETSNWLWRATWVGNICYGVKYGGKFADVVKSNDGINWEYVSTLDVYEATEAQIQPMENGDMVALVRTPVYGRICYSSYPYKDWTARMTNVFLQGQAFVVSLNDKIICVSRNVQEDVVKTSLYCNVSEYNLAKLFDFPSGGDTSYAGIIIEKGRLLVTYHSSHISFCDIYIAEIPIKCLSDRGVVF